MIAWSVGLGAPVPPGDDADEGAVGGLLRDQGATAVPLARVLAWGRGAQHGRGDAHLYLLSTQYLHHYLHISTIIEKMSHQGPML